MAAKNAKIAKTGGLGLEAFALSAFFAAKKGTGNENGRKERKVRKDFGGAI